MASRIPKRNPKKRKVSGWLEYKVQETWDTGPESTLERADINNQNLQSMTKFMTDSRLFKTPGSKPKKLTFTFGSKEYYVIARNRMNPYEFTKCPMACRCSCTAQCKVCIGKEYIWLEFH